ncbi:MAG: CehA/McbA family metallohydrolase [Candidatus Aminicenantes bacterium]|nr:CehA/McbA family metallohydrolase [Candidatus Aminicenantes bacterium]
MAKQFFLWGTGSLLTVFLFGCTPEASPVWYKGNLHTHTTNSDGDTLPAEVIRWYKDNGYHFLSITDHNLITPVDSYRELETDTFILISGNEISDRSEDKSIHLLALGLMEKSVGPAGGDSIVETMQNNVDAINAGGAVPVLAHPNFRWAYGAEEMSRISGCRLFEVLNAHPSVNNAGDEARPSTEEMWDTVLSGGKILYGIGTDDMHRLATFTGKSWIMVQAGKLTEKTILRAIQDGSFYVSTGVIIKRIRRTKSRIQLRIQGDDTTFITQFIGSGGRVLKEDHSQNPIYRIKGNEGYVRARVTSKNGHLALIQPVFLKN